MSKFKIGQDVDIDWTQIHWFHERNSRKEFQKPESDFESATRPLDVDKGETDDSRTGTNKGCVIPLLKGWDVSGGVVKFTEPTKEEIAAAIAQREMKVALWESLAAGGDDVAKRLVELIKPLWFPKGKPVEILAIGNMCYRRGEAMPYVVLARKMRGIDPTGHYAIRCELAEYTDERAKYLDHLRENLGKDFGRAKYGPLDYVKIAATLSELPGGKESDLVAQGCKRGEAQRCWRFVQLARRNRELNLIERVNMEPPALVDGKYPYVPGGFLDVRKFDKEALGRVLGVGEDGVRNPFDKSKKFGTSSKTIETQYLKPLMDGSRAANTWTKADDTFYGGCKAEIVAFVVSAVANNRKDMLDELLKSSDKLNTATKAAVDLDAIRELFDDNSSDNSAEEAA